MASEVMSDTKFGLPSPCESSETEEERNKRLASVTRLVEDVFSAVVEQIGTVEAKRDNIRATLNGSSLDAAASLSTVTKKG